jgi:hypothetical protein
MRGRRRDRERVAAQDHQGDEPANCLLAVGVGADELGHVTDGCSLRLDAPAVGGYAGAFRLQGEYRALRNSARPGWPRVYLRGKPQPTLSNVREGELVHWVGHRVGRLDVSVCPRSELVSGHLIPGFIVILLRPSLNGERGCLLKMHSAKGCRAWRQSASP